MSDGCSERLTAIDHWRPGGHLAGEVVQCPAAANRQFTDAGRVACSYRPFEMEKRLV